MTDPETGTSVALTAQSDAGQTTIQAPRPSAAVVTAVADAEGVDETDLPPLFHAIDPDALDALFDSSTEPPHATGTTGSITFHYHGYDVTVTANGRVEVTADPSQ